MKLVSQAKKRPIGASTCPSHSKKWASPLNQAGGAGGGGGGASVNWTDGSARNASCAAVKRSAAAAAPCIFPPAKRYPCANNPHCLPHAGNRATAKTSF